MMPLSTFVKFEIMLVFLSVSRLLEFQVYMKLRLAFNLKFLGGWVCLEVGFT